jgi:hypothetical protein
MASAPRLAPSARATRSDEERLQPRLLIRSIAYTTYLVTLGGTAAYGSRWLLF